MMKIAHVIDSGGLYGAEVMLLTLASEQVKQGVAPSILSIGEVHIQEKDIEKEADKMGLHVVKFRFHAGFNIRGALRMLDYIKRNGYDVIHSHGYKADILFGFFMRLVRRTPMITTLHGYMADKRFSWLALYEYLDRKSLRFMDGVVTVNQKLESTLECSVRKGAITTIENGVRISDGDQAEHIKLGSRITKFCADGFIVGAVGRLSPEKGYDILIDAITKARATHKNIKLLLLGEGDRREALEKRITQNGLSESVYMPGYIPSAANYFNLLDVFVISSFTEGLPMTLLEAMAQKIPVLATSVGGIPDALNHGQAGELVPAGDSDVLAKKICSMYVNQSGRYAKAELAHDIFLKKYSSERMAREYEEVYKKILFFTSKENLKRKPVCG